MARVTHAPRIAGGKTECGLDYRKMSGLEFTDLTVLKREDRQRASCHNCQVAMNGQRKVGKHKTAPAPTTEPTPAPVAVILAELRPLGARARANVLKAVLELYCGRCGAWRDDSQKACCR